MELSAGSVIWVMCGFSLNSKREPKICGMLCKPGRRPSGLHKVSKLYISDRVSITNLLSCRSQGGSRRISSSRGR